VKTGRVTVVPPQSDNMSSCRFGIAAWRPPLLRFTCLSKTPLLPGVALVRRSRLAVRPLHGLRQKGVNLFYKALETFLRLRPVTEFDLTYPHHRSDARSHEVFRPFDATLSSEPPPAGHPDPRHVASFRLPCGSTPCSRNDIPDVFQSGASMGFGPFRACPFGNHHRLPTVISPPAISEPPFRRPPDHPAMPWVRKHLCLPGRQLIPAAFAAGLGRYAVRRHTFRQWRPTGSGSSTGHPRTARAVPKDCAASLQGFEPSDG